MKEARIILGVDPGSRVTGWGVISCVGRKVTGVDAGALKLGDRASMAERLERLHTGLTQVIEQHQPTAFAIEDIFYSKYAKAAMQLGHARGVAVLCGAQAKLDVATYPPALVKRTVAGKGAADKAQVAQLVGAILGWKELPSLDATDALAIAITHSRVSMMTAGGAVPTKPNRKSQEISKLFGKTV